MMQTVIQNPGLGVHASAGVVDSQSRKPFRPQINVKLTPADLDVERIHDNWRAEKKAAEKVAAAIRLFAALEAGDLDAARKISPFLNGVLTGAEMVGKSQKTKCGSPYKDSDLKDSDSSNDSDPEDSEGVADAIVEVAAIDRQLNQRAVTSLASRLVKAGYTADEVRQWYTSYWLLHDWRGIKGERPCLKDIRELIGRVRALPPLPPVPVAPVDDVNPYLRGVPDPLDFDLPETPAPRPEPVKDDRWLALDGQLQTQFNRATYDTWLSRLTLVGVERSDQAVTYRVLTPDSYVVAHLDQHFRSLMERVLTDLNHLPAKLTLEVFDADHYRLEREGRNRQDDAVDHPGGRPGHSGQASALDRRGPAGPRDPVAGHQQGGRPV